MAISITPGAEPIPGYTLIEPLGRGGFGEVWKAMAPGGIPKAIKFVTGSLEEADGHVPAAQELKSLNRVKDVHHSFILAMERVDIVGGRLMIVMELADRNMLHRLEECQAQGLSGIPRDELLNYMAETAEALDLMNGEFGLQHLDIKPANLFLVYNHVKVADFGLAKDLQGMTAALTSGLTPVYASPETFEGTVSRFSDQYSLAIVYQELLTGKRPITGNNGRQLAMAHVMGQPDLSPLPEAERDIVGRALAKKPSDRYPSCGDFINALRRLPSSRPVPASASSATTAVVRREPRRPEVGATSPAPPLPESKRQGPDPLPGQRVSKATVSDLTLAETEPEAKSRDEAGTPFSPPAAREERTAKAARKRKQPPAATAESDEPAPRNQAQAASESEDEAVRCPRCGGKLIDPGAHGWCGSCGYCQDLEKKEPAAGTGSTVPVLVGGLLVGAVVGLGGWLVLPALRLPDFALANFQPALPALLGLGGGLSVLLGMYAVWTRRPKRLKRKKKRRGRGVSPP